MNRPPDEHDETIERAQALQALRRLADDAFLEFKLTLADSDLSVDEQGQLLDDIVESVEHVRREARPHRQQDERP